MAKVEFHFGELFPRVGFIVTNLTAESRAVVRFYNKRGTVEQWIKESMQAVKMTVLLAAPGGEPPDAAAVQRHAEENHRAAGRGSRLLCWGHNRLEEAAR